MAGASDHPAAGPSFLLSQLGHHAAYRFAERLRPTALAPRHAGILRLLANATEPLTQKELGARLGTVPSRLVVLLDELTARGLVERRTKPDDRRSNHLFLTKKGKSVYATIQRLTLELDEELLSPLGKKERQSLEALMQRLARHHNLLPGVHPAYAAHADLED